jgi:CubicO group peptidase (beta-lactamase class C family)
VARRGDVVMCESWGRADRRGSTVSPDTVWLIASITKPIVCMGLCLLLERGLVGLDDPVHRHLPEFSGPERQAITLRHLLTHTSGLPDMLPENVELRQKHAPLSEFVQRICTTPLLFMPGTDVSYQSTGIALIGEIVARLSGQSCAEFLHQELLGPLGLETASLGWRPELAGKVAECFPSEETPPTDWDWNSDYWRGFAAPWGGMFASALEIARFMQLMLRGGDADGKQLLGTATVREATRNQTDLLPDLPRPARLRTSWGLGWRVMAARESEYFGDLLSPTAYGHAGATGTGTWNDPATGVTFVLCTNRANSGRFIGRVSNAVASSVR